MAAVTTYRCDECGAVKGESNHWYIAEYQRDKATFLIAEWNSRQMVGEYEFLHLCGLPCAIKALSKAMGGSR